MNLKLDDRELHDVVVHITAADLADPQPERFRAFVEHKAELTVRALFSGAIAHVERLIGSRHE